MLIRLQHAASTGTCAAIGSVRRSDCLRIVDFTLLSAFVAKTCLNRRNVNAIVRLPCDARDSFGSAITIMTKDKMWHLPEL